MISGRRVCAIVPAAGSGRRLGPGASMGEPKALVPLAGVPLLVRTLRMLCASDAVDDIVVAAPSSGIGRFEELVAGAGLGKVRRIVPGGETRQDSVRTALAAIPQPAGGVIVVHDCARPFAGGALIRRVAQAAFDSGAAVAAVRPKDTVKFEEGGGVSTPDRERCWLAQTPQAFRTEVLLEAMAGAVKAGFTGTDDVSLVERMGGKVVIIEGSYRNMKITTPEDLEIAEFMLKNEG